MVGNQQPARGADAARQLIVARMVSVAIVFASMTPPVISTVHSVPEQSCVKSSAVPAPQPDVSAAFRSDRLAGKASIRLIPCAATAPVFSTLTRYAMQAPGIAAGFCGSGGAVSLRFAQSLPSSEKTVAVLVAVNSAMA